MRHRPQQQTSRVRSGPRRAAFPEEMTGPGQSSQVRWDTAPLAYEAPMYEKQTPMPPPRAGQDPWEASFIQAEGDWLFEQPTQEDTYSQPQAYQGPRGPRAARAKPSQASGRWLALLLGSLCLILLCLYAVYQAHGPEAGFDAKLQAMRGQTFAEGIYIDNQPVGGLSPAALRPQGGQPLPASGPALDIRLMVDDLSYRFNSSHIPFENNLEQVMEQAFAIGRQVRGRPDGLGLTPFETRFRLARQAQTRKAYFYTEVSYNRALVEQLAAQLAAQTNREAVNAVISSFDFTTKQFSVTQDIKGRQIEPATIATALTQALDRQDYQAVIQLHSTPILPRVSSVDLQNSFTMLSSFTTKTTSDEDRNNNIALAARAISNTTLMPGEVFSFNQATGQRTIQKGYRGAPAIQGGVLIDDVGGGVCQVSSTLFHAAASAGMALVERSPHAWPVSYMDKGLDATVNWPNLDFKFKNNKDTPVFIIASYEKRNLTIEFYGMLGSPGEAIRLEAQLISTTQPPAQPLMQHNPTLPPNTEKELKKARTGYVVDTWRIYLRNGVEFHREKLFTSRYREVQQVIEYN